MNGRYIGDGQWPEKELEGWRRGIGRAEPNEKIRGRGLCSCCKDEARQLSPLGTTDRTGLIVVMCSVCDRGPE